MHGKLRNVAADGRTWLNAWSVGTAACRIGILAWIAKQLSAPP